MTAAAIKLLRWLLFGVVVSTLPIGWAACSLFIHGKPVIAGELFGNGDLLMATCAGCAVALGELIGSGETALGSKIVYGFFALLIIIEYCLVFASITEIRLDHLAYETALLRFSITSICLFCFGTIFGGVAVWVSED
jgi:hypothetical protein